MDYRVTLDPQLGLSAFDFIITWNATPACRAAATARTSASTPVRFDLNVVAGSSVALCGVDPSVGAADLCGLIRQVLAKRGMPEDIAVMAAGPDGILVQPGG